MSLNIVSNGRKQITSNLHAREAWASVLSIISVEVILHHDDFLAAVGVGLEYTLDGGLLAPAFSSLDVPPKKIRLQMIVYLRIANHEFEVVVVVNAC